MPLPSLYSPDPRPWRVARMACCGAAVGAVAALFKVLRAASSSAGTFGLGGSFGRVAEIVAAALAFAVLFAAAAGLRNFLARRLVWRDG